MKASEIMGSVSTAAAPETAQQRASGHLRMVKVPKFSAFPHEIIRDIRVSRDARLLYSVLQMYWWQDGQCSTSHATLAADMGCGLRSLRMYLDELIGAELITESLAGVRRSKVYAPTSNTSKLADCNTSFPADCQESNRQVSTFQSASFDISNTSFLADSKKKTPVKKTKEDVVVTAVTTSGGADAPTDAAAASKKRERIFLGDLSEDARAVLDDWRRKLGKRRAPELNPVLAAELEKAVLDLGTAWLMQANTWAAKNTVRELIKAIRAGYTMREGAEADGITEDIGTVEKPAAGAPKIKPATDEDRALWDQARDGLRTSMSAANFESYIGPLTVAGRGADGGLRILVPGGIAGDSIKRFRSTIIRELMDAGDQQPSCLGFVARRSSP